MEEKAANILLGVDDPGCRFTIKYGWFRFHLRIKLISTERLIKISREISKISDVKNENETFFQALMDHVSDARHIARAIAIATGTRFVPIVARAILKLSLPDQRKLFDIVRSQADSEVFFLHYRIGEETQSDEETTGRVVGGNTIFGRLAAMRVKLGLTDNELMKSSWISLQLQMHDYPYYNPKAKNVISDPAKANAALEKYMTK